MLANILASETDTANPTIAMEMASPIRSLTVTPDGRDGTVGMGNLKREDKKVIVAFFQKQLSMTTAPYIDNVGHVGGRKII